MGTGEVAGSFFSGFGWALGAFAAALLIGGVVWVVTGTRPTTPTGAL